VRVIVFLVSFLISALIVRSAPNVVILLADDQGWNDLSWHGGKRVETPNLDRLFRESLELSTFMAWPVCSPTRAGLLTGRHPIRVGVGPNVGGELKLEETTMAEWFQSIGYRTGVFGKWHNGSEPHSVKYQAAFRAAFKHLPGRKYLPGNGVMAHGFDRAVVYYGGGPDKFTRMAHGGQMVSWFHDHEYRPEERGYLADLIVKYSTAFIRQEAKAGRPFLCYVPFDQVHHPLQAKPDLLARVPNHVTDKKHRLHSAMLLSLDESVGSILKTIDETGIRDNTIVLYFSDNGGLPEGSNLPFRGHKHRTWEGGVHVPAAIRWPAGGFTGGKYAGMLGYLDVMPTVAGLLGKELAVSRPLDGKDCSAALRQGQPSPVKEYYWAWRDHEVVRTPKWKLFRYVAKNELYDMQHDLAESSDVSSANPGVVAQLEKRIAHWREDLEIASPMVSHACDDAPAPRGEVLEISVSQTKPAAPQHALRVTFTTRQFRVAKGDMISYDIMVPKGKVRRDGFFISPWRPGDPPVFNIRMGLDQHGRLQIPGPPMKSQPGEWERRLIAIGHEAPLERNLHAIYFHGHQPGKFKVYLDNLRIVRADGSVVRLWEEGRHVRRRPTRDETEAFQDLNLRVIPLDEL